MDFLCQIISYNVWFLCGVVASIFSLEKNIAIGLL